MPHAFSLTFESSGRSVEFFDEYRITLDMLQVGNPWSIAIWDSQVSQSAWVQLRRDVKHGDRMLLRIDGAPVLNGFVKKSNTKVNRDGGARWTLSGCDVGGNATAWDADPRVQLRGAQLEHALAEILNRVGLVLRPLGANAAREIQGRGRPGSRGASSARPRRRQRVDQSHARPGEKAWDVVMSVLRRMGLMAWVAPDEDYGMSVVIDVPAYDTAPVFTFRRVLRDGVVTRDSDILESDFDVDITNVPTHVYGHGRAARGDQDPQRIRVLVENEELARYPQVLYPLPPQPRWLHNARARTPAQVEQAARRELAKSMASWRTYTLVTRDHGQVVNGAMRLFSLNTMATVDDPKSNLHRADMLITKVEMSGSRAGGQFSTLTLGTKGAIVLVPETA